MDADVWSTLVIYALATAGASFTMTKTVVFDWVRSLVSRIWWLAYLWQCPHCMSHWVAAFFVISSDTRPITGTYLDYLLEIFAIVTLATYMTQLTLLLGRYVTFLQAFPSDYENSES